MLWTELAHRGRVEGAIRSRSWWCKRALFSGQAEHRLEDAQTRQRVCIQKVGLRTSNRVIGKLTGPPSGRGRAFLDRGRGRITAVRRSRIPPACRSWTRPRRWKRPKQPFPGRPWAHPLIAGSRGTLTSLDRPPSVPPRRKGPKQLVSCAYLRLGAPGKPASMAWRSHAGRAYGRRPRPHSAQRAGAGGVSRSLSIRGHPSGRA